MEDTDIRTSPPPPPPAERHPIDCHLDLEVDSEINEVQEHDHIEDIAIPASPPKSCPASSSDPVVLTDELKEKIVRQVEYYFSDENLATDNFLKARMKQNKQGLVPIAVIASFRKMKKLVQNQDISLIAEALRGSSNIIISSDGRRVKRSQPFHNNDNANALSNLVLVENLPEDHSVENLERVFGEVGKMKNISVSNPLATVQESEKCGILLHEALHGQISHRVYAIVQYERLEDAKKAVSVLNDECNWRTGMRVRLLVNKKGKFVLASKDNKGTATGSGATVAVPSTSDIDRTGGTKVHDEKLVSGDSDFKIDEHLPGEANGGGGRQHGRMKGHRQQHRHGHAKGVYVKKSSASRAEVEDHKTNEVHEGKLDVEGEDQHLSKRGGWGPRWRGRGTGRGHGQQSDTVHVSSSPRDGMLNNHVPVPRMPDGTRGFTMGRGRALPLNNSP